MMREPSLSERVRKPWKQLIDVHENSGFNREKNPSRARVTGNRCNHLTLTENVGELSFKGLKRVLLFIKIH